MGAWAYAGTAQFLRVPHIISGTGKATDFKFGQYIQRVHPNFNTKFHTHIYLHYFVSSYVNEWMSNVILTTSPRLGAAAPLPLSIQYIHFYALVKMQLFHVYDG